MNELNFKLYFYIYIILINIISFFVMSYDKNRAINYERRISERTLFTFALLLGAIGIYAGMYRCRHKTKHLKFTILIPALIIINIITVFYIITTFNLL